MNWQFWRSSRSHQSHTCSQLEPLLSLHSDGMTSPQEAALINRHLADCPDCRRALEWMQATRRVIAERPPMLPPIDMRARIAQAIAESERPVAPVRVATRTWSQRPVYAAAATLAALGVIGLMAEHPLPISNVGTQPASTTDLRTPSTRESAKSKPTPAPVPLRHEPSQNIAKSVTSHAGPIAPAPLQQQLARRPAAKTDQLRPVFAPSAPIKIAELPTQHTTSSVVLTYTPSPAAVHAHRKDAAAPLLAILPTTKPDNLPHQASHARPPQMVAARLPADSGKDAHADVIVPTAPAAMTTPAPIQVAHLDVPEGLRPQHEAVHVDLLTSVRLRLASINKEDVTRKVYAAYGAAEQGSSIVRQMPFVQGAIAYTPTALPATSSDQVH